MNVHLNDAWVRARVLEAAARWKEAAGPWVSSKPLFSPRMQRHREAVYDRSLRNVERASKAARHCDTAIIKRRLTATFAIFAAEALDFQHNAIELLTHGFLPVGAELIAWARRFDPGLSLSEVTQACRNAWTACGLQPLVGQPLTLTPAILAYSLLYPYSDNFLDLYCASPAQRHGFCGRFRARLAGSTLSPACERESSIWELVRIIEEEFPRYAFPNVYDSLLAIHDAQEHSMAQLGSERALSESEIVQITCAKGGTSVLADVCLVRGMVTPQEAQFAFLWGVLLQIGDDLQDVDEDLERGSQTIFTRAIRESRPLDALVHQLLNFSDSVAACMDDLPHGEAFFKDLLRMSWRSLIFGAVGRAHTFFTPEFVEQIEAHSAFRFAFLRARQKRLDCDSELIQSLFRVASADESELSAQLPQPVRQCEIFSPLKSSV